jgi:hypothetical protein
MVMEKKVGNKWVETSRNENPEFVHKMLMDDLIAKKLCNCNWIKSIAYKPQYNGTSVIIVTNDNGYRAVFTIKR